MSIAARARTLGLIGWLVIVMGPLAIAQLFMGASPGIVGLVVASGLVCLVPVRLYRPTRTVGALFIGVCYMASLGELLEKSVLFQRVDSNLYNPLLTHLIILAGCAAFSLAAIAGYFFSPWRKNVLPPQLDPRVLSALSWVFCGMILLANPIAKLGANGTAIATFLGNYGPASFICATAAALIASRGRRTISWQSLTVGLFVTAVSVGNNSKSGIMAVGAAYLLTLAAFGVRPKLRAIGLMTVGGLIVSLSLYPAIHLVRSQRGEVSRIELLEQTLSKSVELLARDPSALAEVELMRRQEFLQPYNVPRNRYLGRTDVWYDRFVITGYVDAITRAVGFDGPFLGSGFILDQTAAMLPRQLNPDKSQMTLFSPGGKIVRTLGMSDRDAQDLPTVPMPIELFAAGGFPLIFGIGTPTVFLAVLMLNAFVFDLRRNVWAVLFLTIYSYFMVVQAYTLYLFMMFRLWPVDIIIIFASIWAVRLVMGTTQQSVPIDPSISATSPVATSQNTAKTWRHRSKYSSRIRGEL